MKNIKLNDEVYKVIKWVLFIFVPALTTLISGLGALYGFNTSVVIGTISLVSVFLGSLVGISTVNYNNSLLEAPHEEGTSGDEN